MRRTPAWFSPRTTSHRRCASTKKGPTSSSFLGCTPRRPARGSCARAWREASKKSAPKQSSISRNDRKSSPRDLTCPDSPDEPAWAWAQPPDSPDYPGTRRAAAAWVRKIHTHVRGIDPETGLPYSAEDPSLLLWVHAGMVESIVTVVQRYGRVLDAADADRYVAEMVRFAEIVGVPAEQVPSSLASLRTYIESVELRQATPAARDAIGVVLDPPDLDAEMRDLWHDLAQVAVGTLPDWAREMYGFAAPPAELMEREPVHQLLGALDLAFESLPGVLEARRRIELRMRSG